MRGLVTVRKGHLRIMSATALMAAAGCVLPAAAWGQQDAGKPTPAAPEKPSRLPGFEAPNPNAAAATTNAPDPEKPSYLIGGFLVRYAVEHPQYPALDDLMKAQVTLGVVDGGFVKVSDSTPTSTYTLEELSSQPAQRYTTLALFAVQRAVKAELERQGIFAALVGLSEKEFAPNENRGDGEAQYVDLRPKGATIVTLVVRSGVVGEMRTIAFGERVPYEDRINNPRHQKILDNSPVRVFDPDDETRNDVLQKEALDNYIFRLNRHPGRRVDLTVAAGEKNGQLAMDYLVNESKPWTLYFQISNTGTKETDEWRERFGFVHNQLTGEDDILSMDFVTAGFTDKSNVFSASYDRPLWGDWLRGKVYGSANSFQASDVGGATRREEFEGDGYSIGAELAANVFQYRELFVDVYGGARFEHLASNPSLPSAPDVSDDFFLPSLGTRLERNSETASTSADVGVEFNLPDVAHTSAETIDNFSRPNADDNWVTLQWDVNHSFYLEPVIIPERWGRTEGPGAMPTLAHEMLVSFKGQYAFGNRLIPNFEQVLGGMYTVRGYPESAVAGDTIAVGTLEYRFHLPQATGFSSESGMLFGKPFRFRPQVPYGRADWDLVLKGFLDVGRSENSGRLATEMNETLVGTGVGVELLYKRNFTLRVDWGVALGEIENEVSEGSNRFHISATILY